MIGTPKSPGIYKITIGDRFYYGSSVNLAYRERQHRGALVANRHENRYMQNAFNKHGTFAFDVVELIGDNSMLLESEQKYISDNFRHDLCMNICPTAGNCLGVKHSEETRRNMSKSRIGLMVGMFHPLFGKKRSSETIEKISNKIRGSKYTDEHLIAHRKMCKRKSRRAKIAKAKTGTKQSAETVEKRVSKFRGADNWRAKKVWIKTRDSNELFFDTVTEAARFLDVNHTLIVRYLNGTRNWPVDGGCRNDKTKSLIGLKGGYL